MAGKSPAEAVENFVAPLKRVLQCVATHWVVASHYAPIELDQPRALLVGEPSEGPIVCRDDLVLEIAHYFHVVKADGDAGPYRCRTLGYLYDFRHPDGPGVMSFHWHPDSAHKSPHIHMPQYIDPVDVSKVHIPTGRTSLETIVRLAIDEFGASPLRSNWAQILTETEAAFEQYREW